MPELRENVLAEESNQQRLINSGVSSDPCAKKELLHCTREFFFMTSAFRLGNRKRKKGDYFLVVFMKKVS